MSPNIKKTKWIYRVIPLYIVAILLCLAITPSENTYAKNYTTKSILMGTIVKELPSWQTVRIYSIVGAGNETFNEIETYLTISKSFRDFKSTIYRIFNILLTTIEFGVFIYCLGYFIKKKKQHIPIMATSIGGHAPPKVLRAILIS